MDPFKIVTGGPSDHNAYVWETGTGVLANKLDCRLPESYDYVYNAGLSNMAVDGCRIVTSCNGMPGHLYFRDFSDCSVHAYLSSSSHEDSGSKFWKSRSDSDDDDEADDVPYLY